MCAQHWPREEALDGGTRLRPLQTPRGSSVNSCASINDLKAVGAFSLLRGQVGKLELLEPSKSKRTLRLREPKSEHCSFQGDPLASSPEGPGMSRFSGGDRKTWERA